MDEKCNQLEGYKNELSKVKEANFHLLKKLNKTEHDRIEESSLANEKIVALQAQIVKLRSENEKSTVNHQDLELQLAKAGKRCRNFERSLATNEQQLKSISRQNEEKFEELQNLLMKKDEEICSLKDEFSHKEDDLLSKVDELNHLVRCKREEISLMENELEKLRSHLTEHSQQLENVKESAGSLKADKSDLETILNDKDADIRVLRNEKQKWQEEKDTISYKTHRLEECLEAERTAHLESKYNAELVQLRLNQSESSVAECQSRLEEANQIINTLSHRLKDTETALEEEAKYARQYRHDLDRVKSEPEIQKTAGELNKQMQRNVELTSALQDNSKKLSELQRELKQVTKKKDLISTEKDALLQEIQVLLESYYNVPPNSGLESSSKKDKTAKYLMDQLKNLIQSQRRKLQETTDEIDKLTRNVEQINREFLSNKDQSNQREKELKEAQNSFSTANAEMSGLRDRLVEFERKIANLRAANSELKRGNEKERQSTSILHEEIARLKKMRTSELQDRDELSRVLYGRLNRVGYSIEVHSHHQQKPERDRPKREQPSKNKSNPVEDIKTSQSVEPPNKQISWPQMKTALCEGVTLISEALLKRQKEVQRLRSIIAESEKRLSNLEEEKIHQQKELDDLNTSYNKHKQELTQRFVRAVEQTSLRNKKRESRSKSNKRNTSAEESSDQTPLPDSSRSEQLEMISQSDSLLIGKLVAHSTLQPSSVEGQERLLLATVALLTSLYFPLREKAEQLAQERAVLSNLLYKYYSNSYCSRLRSTARTIHSQIHGRAHAATNKRDNLARLSGIFRFRIVSILIVAANRFNKLSVLRHKSSTTNQPIKITPRTPRVGAPLSLLSLNADSKNSQIWLQQASKWMTSPVLVEIVSSSMNDLLPYLSPSTAQSNHFPNIVQNCLTKFISESKQHLFVTSSQYFQTIHRSGSSRLWDDDEENGELLHVRLGEGLIGVINRFKDRALITPKAISSYLDRSVTQLCKDYQESKSHQQEMKVKADSLESRCRRLESETSNASRLQETINHSVSKEKFDNLLERYQKCSEESSDAKQLLNQQAYEIQSMCSQLDLLAESEKEFEQEVRDLKEALAEAQAELCVRNEELAARESSSQLSHRQNNQLENRLRSTDDQVLKMQRDFDSCLSYLSAVIHHVSPHLSGKERPSAEDLMTQEDSLIETNRDSASPESSILIASRNVVRTLLAQYGLRLERNLKTAQDQIVQYRSQVAAINREDKLKKDDSQSSG